MDLKFFFELDIVHAVADESRPGALIVDGNPGEHLFQMNVLLQCLTNIVGLLDFLGILVQLAPLLAYEGSSPPFVGKLFLFFIELGLELPRLLFELLFTEDFGVIMVFLDIGQLFLNHGHLLFDFRFR